MSPFWQQVKKEDEFCMGPLSVRMLSVKVSYRDQ
jgi:hypothetical protein